MTDQITTDITPKEYQLLLYLRELKYGKVEITIHGGEPKYAEKREEKTYFDGNIPEVVEVKEV